MARDRTDAHELPTPRSISRIGYRVHVWCKACRHAKDADLAALIDAGKGDVSLVRMNSAAATAARGSAPPGRLSPRQTSE
jgi:hypothetical protein